MSVRGRHVSSAAATMAACPERTDLMTDQDLDRSYSALCESLAIVGERKAELFLSMVCLALMARYERAEDVLSLIAHVQAQCAAEATDDA
jgi:hypothetical protein